MSWIDVLILTAVIAVIAIAYYFLVMRDKSGDTRKSRNMSGNAAAAGPLGVAKRYAMLQQYRLLAPAQLAKDGRFADFDFILVGAFGLLCVRCIGLGGEIYGGADDENWLQVTAAERLPFANPIKKAAQDTRLVRDALFTAKLKSVPVESAVVFTNKKATLALPRTTGHYTAKDFSSLLNKDRFLADKGVDMDKAADAVRAYLVKE